MVVDMYRYHEYVEEVEVAFCLYGKVRNDTSYAEHVFKPGQIATENTVEWKLCPRELGALTLVGFGHSHPNVDGNSGLSGVDLRSFARTDMEFTLLVSENEGNITITAYGRSGLAHSW